MKRKICWIAALLGLAAGHLQAGEFLIDDFVDGNLEAQPGLSWVVIADDAIGGGSQAELAVVPRASGHTLKLVGKLGQPPKGFPVSFLGLWTAVDDEGRSFDLSAFQGIRMRARGQGGGLTVGVRGSASPMNYVAAVEIGPEWTELEVPFSKLRGQIPSASDDGWTPEDIAWVGLSFQGAPEAEVRLELDRIAFYAESKAAKPTPSPARSATSAVVKTKLVEPDSLRRLAWKSLAQEEAGDDLRGGSLPDARAVDWALDGEERLWIRVRLANAPPQNAFGVNVALETSGDPDDGMPWWGSNSSFRFDHLVTAYLSRGDGYWQGVCGLSGFAQVQQGNMTAESSAVVASVDREHPALLVGIPRADLPKNDSLRLIVTVGSAMVNNDDIPNQGSLQLDLAAVSKP